MILKAKKKPITIEVIQYLGNIENEKELYSFCGSDKIFLNHLPPYLITKEGPMLISKGDYIAKGVIGEFYCIKEEIFNLSYDIQN